MQCVCVFIYECVHAECVSCPPSGRSLLRQVWDALFSICQCRLLSSSSSSSSPSHPARPYFPRHVCPLHHYSSFSYFLRPSSSFPFRSFCCSCLFDSSQYAISFSLCSSCLSLSPLYLLFPSSCLSHTGTPNCIVINIECMFCTLISVGRR